MSNDERAERDTANSQPATSPGTVTAVVVWNGDSRGSRDVTVYFISEAQKRGFASREVGT